jgi:excisionase family DNA binding protein
MESLKVDITKLKTAANYAKKVLGVERQTVYNKIKSGELKAIKIDGVLFVKL